jgi:hypothetical protein
MGQHDFATSDFRCGIEELTCSRSHARKYTLLRSRPVSHFLTLPNCRCEKAGFP